MNLANDLKGTRDRILIAMEGSLVHVAVRDLRPGSAAGVISEVLFAAGTRGTRASKCWP